MNFFCKIRIFVLNYKATDNSKTPKGYWERWDERRGEKTLKFAEMIPTKDKILQASLCLFNSKGVAGTTLRDIAAQVGISSGNLAYHFKNKDIIVKALFEQMESERKELLSKVQSVPSFENIHRQAGMIMDLSRKYHFLLFDSLYLLRSFPRLAAFQAEYIDGHITYIKSVLDYSVASGNLQKESQQGLYDRLSHTVWMLLHFWLMQQTMRGNEDRQNDHALQNMWALVWPHLTEKGRHNFEQIRKQTYKTGA